MTNRADLILAIQANTDALKAVQADLTGIGQSSQRAAQETTTALDRIKERVAALGLDRLAEAATQAGVAQVRASFQAGESLENLRTRYTNLLGSQQAANTEITQLQQIANNSAFTLPGLAQGEARLISAGKSAAEARTLLLAVGNTAAGIGANQEGTDRIVVALQQMIDKGRVSSQELNQLSENGVAGLALLAQYLGKSAAETQKLVETGTVAADVFVRAFEANAAQRFGNAMRDNANTMQGLLSTASDLRDTLGGGFMESAFKEAEPTIARVLGELQDPRTVENLRELGKAAGDAAASALTMAENFGKAVGLIAPPDANKGLTDAQAALDNLLQTQLAMGQAGTQSANSQADAMKDLEAQIRAVNRSEQDVRTTYRDLIDPLQEALRLENERYQTAVSARNLKRASERVTDDQGLATDIFTSAGQAARDRLPGERDRVSDLQFEQAHQQRVDGINDEIAKRKAQEQAALDALAKEKRGIELAQEEQRKTNGLITAQTQGILGGTKAIVDQITAVQNLALAWNTVASEQAKANERNAGAEAAATDQSNMNQLGAPGSTPPPELGAAFTHAMDAMTKSLIARMVHPDTVGSNAANDAAVAAQAQLAQVAGNALGTAFAGPNNKKADEIWMGGAGSAGMYHYPILGVDWDKLMGRPYNVPAPNAALLGPVSNLGMTGQIGGYGAGGQPVINVYIGAEKLKDIVRTEIANPANGQAMSQNAANYGRGRTRGWDR